METDSNKLFRKLQRQVYSDAKNNMIYRYKRYAGYCQIHASSENEELRKVYEFLENDVAAYMAPAVLSFARCKLTPQTLKDKRLDTSSHLSIISATGDAINTSILHAIRILLDRTSFYMHTAYHDCEIGNGIGSIEPNKKTGVMKFIDKQLNSNAGLTAEERNFFSYLLNEHNEWFHEVVQVDNKTKHNLSAYDLYEIGMNNIPPIILSSAKRYYKDKELTVEKDIPVDFETKYISRAYKLFDKTLEFTTSVIASKAT